MEEGGGGSSYLEHRAVLERHALAAVALQIVLVLEVI